MTTPMPPIALPYSVVYTLIEGTGVPTIEPSMRNVGEWNSSRVLTLGPGAYMVSLTWNGTGRAVLTHRPIYMQALSGVTVAAAETLTRGVPATSSMVTVSASGKHHLSVQLDTPSPKADVDYGCVATVTVFPIQRYGA